MFRLGLAFCILLSVANPVSGSTQKIADQIYYGGEIITADDARPAAQSAAVHGGRIVGVGPLAEIVRLRGADTELVDLEGRTLAPGFIDACGHLSRNGLQAVTANLLPPPDGRARSIADMAVLLRQWQEETPAAQELGLILGFGYDASQFNGERRLTRADLDAVSAELPVIAIHRSGNESVFNTSALELAGMGGGEREPHSEAGLLQSGTHRRALRRVLETLAERNIPMLIDSAQQLYARFGHTTAQDGRPGRAVLEAYRELAAGGQFKIDVIAYPGPARDGSQPILQSAYHSRNYVNGFRIGGVMLRFDGAPPADLAGLRARSSHGYADPLITSLGSGRHVIAYPEGLPAAAKFTAALREAVAIPGAIRRPVMVIDARAPAPEQLDTLFAYGVVPALLLAPAGAGEEGEHGAAGTDIVRILMNEGLRFTACHGAPDAPPDPLRVMAGLIRQGSEDAAGIPPGLDRMPALKAVTLWAAGQYFEEGVKGSVTVGKLADLVILSANPLTADMETLTEINVVETIKEGESIFMRTEATGKPALACADSAPCFSGISAALGRVGPAPPGVSGRSARLDSGRRGFLPPR